MINKIKKIIFANLLICFIILFPLSSQAVGISVNPSSLDILYPSIREERIAVKNISSEPIVVYIYPDDFGDNIKLQPNEFNLMPDQLASIKILTNFDNFSEGTQKTNISVLSKALDKKSFNAISGIKIPISIYIAHTYFEWSGPAVFVLVFGVGLTILLLWQIVVKLFPKKKKIDKKMVINLLLHHKKKKWYQWR